ncbi:tRNA pseudouridine synthase 1 [Quaeritorhiza haematococci]|nr:tRNA pseudouridine synthase 1 [Quaeritorhiza haematococci]
MTAESDVHTTTAESQAAPNPTLKHVAEYHAESVPKRQKMDSEAGSTQNQPQAVATSPSSSQQQDTTANSKVDENDSKQGGDVEKSRGDKNGKSDKGNKWKNNKWGKKKGNQKPNNLRREGKKPHPRTEIEWGPREKPEDPADGEEKGQRLPKRKVAVLLGYCGTGYNGMQINPNVKTIEGELHKAFAAAGAVSEDNALNPHKVGSPPSSSTSLTLQCNLRKTADHLQVAFMRAARTDKGVHALGQVVSMKMIIEDPDIIPKINQHLPDQIRVWGVVRVSKGFHAQHQCDSRIYQYVMPTYVLKPPKPYHYPLSAAAKKANVGIYAEDGAAIASEMETRAADLSYVVENPPPPSEDRMAEMRQYRITESQLSHLREILRAYQGTNNFHNFTVGRKFEESSSKRYIINFECSDPIVRDGIEWVTLKVLGQSFMLHQIRKMVGLAILMVRTETPVSLVRKTYGRTRVNIPKAPSLGLFLDRTLFTQYNKTFVNRSQHRGAVLFDPYDKEIEEFKRKWIFKNQAEEEMECSQFMQWIGSTDAHWWEFAWFLAADGELHEQYKPKTIGVPGNKIGQAGDNDSDDENEGGAAAGDDDGGGDQNGNGDEDADE